MVRAFICEDGSTRWAKRKPFLATSPQQVKAYQRSQGHAIAKTKDGDETSGQKSLLLAWRKYKDDLYWDFVDFRKLKKLRGTYGEWTIGVDDRVRTRFTLRPDTGRLSSIQPNIQNIPKDGPLSRKFRECLVSSPGCLLVRADLASVEALLTGWFARDPGYMRLAKLGIHKFSMAKYLGLPVSTEMPDEELIPILEGMKERDPMLYRVMKVCLYGGNYLAGARTVYHNNPETFESEGQTKKFLQFVLDLSPKVKQWKQDVIRQATAAHCLTNPFGYRKEFWDLPGGDGPAAVAFLPQSTVAAIMKEIMLECFYRREIGVYMVWQIHDELVLDVPKDRVERVANEIYEVMTQSWPQLGGLSIPVEVKVSESMA